MQVGRKSDLPSGLKCRNTLVLGPEETIMFLPAILHSRSQNTVVLEEHIIHQWVLMLLRLEVIS